MNYGQFTVTTARHGYRNLVGLVVISLLAGLAFAPLVAMAFVGTSLALLGGLWTTCLLLGIVVVAAFRFSTTVARRGVPMAILPSVASALRSPTTGLAVGTVTFGIVVVAVAVVGIMPEAYRPMAVGFAGFLLVAWFLITAFAAPELGDGRRLSPALRKSGIRIGRSPDHIMLFLILSFACTLVAGVTVVTLLLFLPGVLALLAARAAIGASAENSAVDAE